MPSVKKLIEDSMGSKKPENKSLEVALERLHPPKATPNGVVWLDDTKEGWERTNKDWDKIDYNPIVNEKSDLEKNNPMSSRSGVKIPIGSKLAIDDSLWLKIAKNRDFQRVVTFIIKQVDPFFKGVDPRNSKIMLAQINERTEIITNIQKEIKRGSKMAMRECMKELEEVLRKREKKNL